MARLGRIAANMGLGAAVLYLAANAVTGQQGLAAYMALQDEEQQLAVERAALEAERAALRARAERLNLHQIDLDYLDERARALLAAQEPEEIVFALPAPAEKPVPAN